MKEPQPASLSSALNLSPYCINLRSKKLFFGSAPAMEEADVLDGSGHCWCRCTMQILGPDKGRAAPSRCLAGRVCFESILLDAKTEQPTNPVTS